jgi:serine protease Do
MVLVSRAELAMESQPCILSPFSTRNGNEISIQGTTPMQKTKIVATFAGVLTLIAISLSALMKASAEDSPSAASCPTKSGEVTKKAGQQSFDDIQARSQHFADELERLKEEGQTIPIEKLVEQAQAEKTYRVEIQAGSNEKLSPEAIYTRSRPGVMVLGGIYKCTKCQRWHAQCAGGFAAHKDGLIVTNLHVVEGFKKLEVAGAMTDDGRVFPIKAVLASSHLDDLALLKINADNLQPLPIAEDISVGSAVYCLSHPVLSEGKINCFYAFTTGIVAGKFSTHNDKQQPMKVLAVTADYGPGASGGPILNEHGAVVAVVCQAIPLLKLDHEKEVVPMVWKFARPSCDILTLLGKEQSALK